MDKRIDFWTRKPASVLLQLSLGVAYGLAWLASHVFRRGCYRPSQVRSIAAVWYSLTPSTRDSSIAFDQMIHTMTSMGVALERDVEAHIGSTHSVSIGFGLAGWLCFESGVFGIIVNASSGECLS